MDSFKALPVDARMKESLLRTIRKRRKLSIAKLAAAVNTVPSQIVRLEAGQRKMTTEWADRLAPVLNVSPQELLFPSSQNVPIIGALRSEIVQGGVGEFGSAPMPPGGYAGLAAITVDDDSIYGVAGKGWLIYFEKIERPIQPEFHGELCVCGYADGRMRVGIIQPARETGLFDLERPGAPLLRNQRLTWASPVFSLMSPFAAKRMAPPSAPGAAA